MHVTANEDGKHVAIAGRQGLILYDFQNKRWRIFGDINQEREIQHWSGVAGEDHCAL
jgi:hypothetical protein